MKRGEKHRRNDFNALHYYIPILYYIILLYVLTSDRKDLLRI